MTARIDKRRAASEETKRAILDAARAVLHSGDLTRFSLDAVAKQASVSRLTIYYQFGSKHGLLDALYDDLAAKGGITQLAKVFRMDDPGQALRQFVVAFCNFWSSEPDLLRKLRAFAVLDPDFQSVVQRDEWRRNGLKVVLHRARMQTSGLADAELDRVVDLACVITSFETYDGLGRSGRSQEDATDMIVNLVSELSIRQ